MALTQNTHLTTRWAATPSSSELARLSLVGAVIFFGGWQLVAMSGLVSQYVLPSPIAVLEQIYRLEAELAHAAMPERCPLLGVKRT